MRLPNEIDQDVACPECGEALLIADNGNDFCDSRGCLFIQVHRKHVAALRNQRTPNTTEIPTSELEALREAFSRHKHSLSLSIGSSVLVDLLDADLRAVDAVLAHIPAKVDHVARLRTMLKLAQRDGDERDAAALEAAIEAMERKP